MVAITGLSTMAATDVVVATGKKNKNKNETKNKTKNKMITNNETNIRSCPGWF